VVSGTSALPSAPSSSARFVSTLKPASSASTRLMTMRSSPLRRELLPAALLLEVGLRGEADEDRRRPPCASAELGEDVGVAGQRDLGAPPPPS
jgi:hypothetical protein